MFGYKPSVIKNEIMKKIFFAFGAFICIPHILLFALRRKSDGGQKLSKDINVWLSRKNHSGYGQIKGLVYLLLKLKEFRNLYYPLIPQHYNLIFFIST